MFDFGYHLDGTVLTLSPGMMLISLPVPGNTESYLLVVLDEE